MPVATVSVTVSDASNAYDCLNQWARLPFEKSSDLPATAKQDLKRLCGRLGVDLDSILPVGDRKSQLVAAKILASYYRQLLRLLQPSEDVEFLEAADIVKEHFSIATEDDDDEEVA